MVFDDLGKSWQEQNAAATSAVEREQLVASVIGKTDKLGSVIIRRDWVETAAAVFVVVTFGAMVLTFEAPIARLGALIVVVGALFIIYKLHHTRLAQKPPARDASVHDYCTIEIERLEGQIRLLRSILWWYILPLMIGANLITGSFAEFGWFSLVYAIFTLLFSWGIYVLNQRAVAKHLVPVRDELAALLSDVRAEQKSDAEGDL